MRLIVRPSAAKALSKVPARVAATIVARMESVAADPFGRHPNVKRLVGQEGFRLRIGRWRVLYHVDRTAAVVVLDDIRKREEAYR